RDEHPRPDTTIEALRKLAPVFGEADGQPGIVTAGSSSGITDGGAAVVLSSAERAEARRLKPRAKILGWASAGVDPRIMGIGPVPAIRKLTDRTRLSVADFDLIDLNEVFGRTFDLEMLPYGADHYLQTGISLPPNGYQTLRQFAAIFIGALGDPRIPDMRHARDILLGTRFELDLYVNHRPVKLLHERLCPLKDRTPKDVDFVVFRENTEGVYVNVGGRFKAGTDDEVAVQEEINTFKGVHRIVKHAFEHAKAHRLTKVCMADKSNAMTHGHALWQRVFVDLAREYPAIDAIHLYIDALAMQMVKNPAQFEVIVTNNMFGDIVTDLGAQLQGGLGMAASGNLHPGRTSMFEPVHGSAPKYAGKN